MVLIVGTAPTTPPEFVFEFDSYQRTPTQPDTSRNRPAGAPLRPPVIDGIEELDQDSKLDNALHIEELDNRGAQLPRFNALSPHWRGT